MTSWLETKRNDRAIRRFIKLFKHLPTTERKREAVVALFKECNAQLPSIKGGLVYIDAWDVTSDREGRIYVFDYGQYTRFSPVNIPDIKEEERLDAIWPTFLP